MPSQTETVAETKRKRKDKQKKRERNGDSGTAVMPNKNGDAARSAASGDARARAKEQTEGTREGRDKKGKDKERKAEEKQQAKARRKEKEEAKARNEGKQEAKGKEKKGKDKKAKEKKGKDKRAKKETLADRADRHDLYQRAVQTPETEVEFFTRVFEEKRDRTPMTLREDFCGTAHLASTWVKSDSKRRAIGVDLDGATLAWGREHNLSKLGDAERSRIELHQANVLDGVGEPTDMVCAMNFSYCVFKRREQLKHYFEVVRDRLADDGIFVTEAYGGLEAVVELEEKRKCDGFTYIWEQEKYNPITHETLCHISFQFRDKSRLERAFTYDWRLWTLPELRELLLEAGFKEVTVWWEEVDEDGDGSGEYHPTEEEENQESWLAYIVAVK